MRVAAAAAAADGGTILVVDEDSFEGGYVARVLASRGWQIRGPVATFEDAQILIGTGERFAAGIVAEREKGRGAKRVIAQLHRRRIPALQLRFNGAAEISPADGDVLAAPFAAYQVADWVSSKVEGGRKPSKAKRCVLVTGGAGYIGSHAVLALLDAGWPVVVIDNLSTGFEWAVDQRAQLIVADIADEDVVCRTMRAHDVIAVLHFAGSIVVPESVRDPIGYYRNNTATALSLIGSAVRCAVRHFVFSSTAATYGVPLTIPIVEDSRTLPINPYGSSKLMIETMLRDIAAAHSLNYCALRYFNVAGADPLGRGGQSTTIATHLIKITAEAVTGKRPYVEIYGSDFDTEDGTGVRDYVHVSDLAAAHVDALDLLIADPLNSHTMNCGYGRGYSVLQVLDAIDRMTGVRVNRRWADRREGDPAVLVADNRRILETLPWRPVHDDLETIIRHAVDWERKLTGIRQLVATGAASAMTGG